MDDEQQQAGDLALTVVPQVGRLVDTGEDGEPFRLVDPDGVPVAAARTYFRELQASGRSTATLRSYGMDLLRWFRFCWAIDVGWDRATRVEAREFSRWLRMPGQPVRAHWRAQQTTPVVPARAGEGGRGLLGFGLRTQRNGVAWLLRLPPGGRQWAAAEPLPVGSATPRGAGARASQSDGAAP